jgi:hypothetical protein
MSVKFGSRTKAAVIALAAGVVTASWAQAALTLSYKGSVVSHRVRMLDGQAYVPVADMAKLLNGRIVRTDGGYQIQGAGNGGDLAGGANQVNGLQGSIGQMLFTGKWRFEVLSVTHEASYTFKYDAPSAVTPNGANDELVVVDCLLKNAQTSSKEAKIDIHSASNTALTDDQGQSYPPIEYDVIGGSAYGPPSMLPGSSTHFAAIFSVPKTANLKDLVFSVGGWSEDKLVDVRITLAQ